jgi:hypothetical protein
MENAALPQEDTGLSGLQMHERLLQGHLLIRPPGTIKEVAPTLSFERQREIDFPWGKIFDPDIVNISSGSMAPLRAYFERSWRGQSAGGAAAPADALTAVDPAAEQKWLLSRFDTKQEVVDKTPVPTDVALKVEVVRAGAVIKDGYGRRYLCKPQAGQRITGNELGTPEDYESFWSDKLSSIEMCFSSAEDAASGSTRVERIDLAAKAILDAYRELDGRRAFDSDLQKALDGRVPQMIDGVLASGPDLDGLAKLEQTVVTLRQGQAEIAQRRQRLAAKAAELGYLLVLEDKQQAKFPDGKARPDIKAGNLYRQFRRLYQWTTTVERVECPARQGLRKVTSFFGIESPQPKRWTEKQAHSATVVDVQLVDSNDNPFNDKVTELGKTHSVFVFAQTANGYYTEDRTSLREVMLRCERDEAFRRSCAVCLPILETSLSGRRAISGYNVFVAPMPGIVPTMLPKLAVHEFLSYRMAWRETRLGEIAHSINLAPGETRSITVRRSYEQETSFSQKRTTIFDLQESESTDFTSEIENQLEQTQSSGLNLSLSRSASASVPVEGASVSASASGSFGYNRSVGSFSKTLSKAVKKAAQSINRNTKDEVSTDSRQVTKVSNFDEYTSTISNINEGRTLNLLFYRLRNAYDAGLYLEDLQFRVTPSVEIIAGSDVHDIVTFEADQLDDLLEEFSASHLPFYLEEPQRYTYLRLVCEALEQVLEREYKLREETQADQAPAPGGEKATAAKTDAAARKTGPTTALQGAIAAPARTVSVLQLPAAAPQLASAYADAVVKEDGARSKWLAERQAGKSATKAAEPYLESTRASFEAKRDELADRLAGMKVTNPQIFEELVEVVAPGLYVDSLVGAVPSTELYSERMREQVIAAKKADVAVTNAEAQYKLSLASRMAGGTGNYIVGVMPYRENDTLVLRLKAPLGAGSWSVFVDGKKVGDLDSEQSGGFVVHVELEGDDRKLLADDGLIARQIELRSGDGHALVRQFASIG